MTYASYKNLNSDVSITLVFGCFFLVMLSEGYINNILHLTRKYARIFVHGHYLFKGSEQFSESGAQGKLWATMNR